MTIYEIFSTTLVGTAMLYGLSQAINLRGLGKALVTKDLWINIGICIGATFWFSIAALLYLLPFIGIGIIVYHLLS